MALNAAIHSRPLDVLKGIVLPSVPSEVAHGGGGIPLSSQPLLQVLLQGDDSAAVQVNGSAAPPSPSAPCSMFSTGKLAGNEHKLLMHI